MKISVADLKKAVRWIEEHTNESFIRVNEYIVEGGIIEIICQDKYDTQVRIKIYQDGNMLPKITREDVL